MSPSSAAGAPVAQVVAPTFSGARLMVIFFARRMNETPKFSVDFVVLEVVSIARRLVATQSG